MIDSIILSEEDWQYIENLQDVASEAGMTIDWETLGLMPLQAELRYFETGDFDRNFDIDKE